MMIFPTVSGSNLEGRSFSLPRDLEGTANLLLIPFQMWQQNEVDTWLPAARQLSQRYPALRYYEIPTLPHFDPLRRWWIDSGMRAGIPDRRTREITITLYTDLNGFCRALAIPDLSHTQIMLLDRAGAIHWRAAGSFTPALGQSLTQTLSGTLESLKGNAV